jgi:hypothetical protein
MLKKSGATLARNNVTLSLLYFNFHYHGQIMRDVLFRHKIFVLFLVAVLAPAIENLIYFLTIPVNALYVDHVKNIATLSYSLLSIQLFSLFWIMLHQSVIFRQPWAKYILSLQISNAQILLVEMIMLLFINIIIWVPLVFADVREIYNVNYDVVKIMLLISKCILFFMLTILIQIGWSKTKYTLLGSVLLIDAFLILISSKFGLVLQTLMIMLLMPICVALISHGYRELSQPLSSKSSHNIFKIPSYKFYNAILNVKIKCLIQNLGQLSLIFTGIILITLLGVCFIKFGKSSMNLPLFLSIIMLINVLTLSNLFMRMNLQWKQFRSYLKSLPISGITLFKIKYTLVAFISVIVNAIIIVVSFLFDSHIINKLLISLLVSLIFLLVTYIPQVKFGRYGFFLSFCLVFVFSYLDFLLMY